MKIRTATQFENAHIQEGPTTITDLLKSPDSIVVRHRKTGTYLVWGTSTWQVYQWADVEPRQIISTPVEAEAVAAFVKAAGIESEEGTLTIKKV